MTSPVFVPLLGQFENLGDIMLRRRLLRWIGESGRPAHVLLGPAPDGFVDALDPPPHSVLYRSMRGWCAAMAKAAPGSSYVYKPGEIVATAQGVREPAGLLPFVANLRRRGGTVLRVGAGLREPRAPFTALMRPSNRVAHRVWWRDAQTRRIFGTGDVMPDLAFAEGSGPDVLATRSGRDRLVVSFRGDRPPLREDYLLALDKAARDQGLRLTVVTQVRRDEPVTRALAERFGVDAVSWDSLGDRAQEQALRRVYRESAVVISDRLHVLIAAVTEGAAPVGIVPQGHAKIARHFAAAGVDLQAGTFGSGDTPALLGAVAAARAGRVAVAERIGASRARLDDVRAGVLSALGTA